MGRAGSRNHTQSRRPATGKVFTQPHQLHQAFWLGWEQLDCGTNLNQARPSSWIVGFWGTGFVTPCWPREPDQGEQVVSAAVSGSVARRKPCLSPSDIMNWHAWDQAPHAIFQSSLSLHTDVYKTWQRETGMVFHLCAYAVPLDSTKSMLFPTYFLLIPADLPLPFLLLLLPACLTWGPSTQLLQKGSGGIA